MSVRWSWSLLTLFAALVSPACKLDLVNLGWESPPPPPQPCQPSVSLVRLAPQVDTVEVGRGLRLSVRPLDRAGRNANQLCSLAMASRDTTIARVEWPSSGFTGGFQMFVTGVRVGTTTVSVTAEGKTARAQITVVPIREGFVAATAACALTPSGVAYCWGAGNPVPARVRGGVRFTSLVGSSTTPCGLGTNGGAYCWGTRLASDTPVAVSAGMTFRSLSVNGVDTCGMASAGGAYCWGPSVGGGSSVPQLVPGPIALDTVVVGEPVGEVPDTHACGLTAMGAAYCWGGNARGQLGSTTASTPIPTAVLGDLRFRSITAGGAFTCGLTQDSLAYCWGWAAFGQLGDSGAVTTRCGNEYLNICSQLPLPVAGGLRFVALAAGSEFACGLVPSGAAYCWGLASILGRGGDYAACDMGRCYVPGAVVGGHAFRSIATGYQNTCAVSDDSIVYCWGNDDVMRSDIPLRMSGQP